MKNLLLIAILAVFSVSAFAEGESQNDLSAGVICSEELNKTATSLDEQAKKDKDATVIID